MYNFIHFSKKSIRKKRKNKAKIISNKLKDEILDTIRQEQTSISNLKDDLGITASKTTIWRTIHNISTVRYRKIMAKPVLTDAHKEAKLVFSRDHMTWNKEWKAVV